MKKIISTFSFLLLLIFSAFSQDYSKAKRLFKKGEIDFQIGIGPMPSDMFLDRAKPTVLPTLIGMEKMLEDNISLALVFGHSVMETPPKLRGERMTQLQKTWNQFTLKTAFHNTRKKDTDLYGGFLLSANFYHLKALQGDMGMLEHHFNIRPFDLRLGYGGFVGGRYAFQKKWTAWAEASYGHASFLNVGVGYRLL